MFVLFSSDMSGEAAIRPHYKDLALLRKPFIPWNAAKELAKKDDYLLQGDDELTNSSEYEWLINLKGFHLFVIHSRLIQYSVNLYKFLFTVVFVTFRKGDKNVWFFSFFIIVGLYAAIYCLVPLIQLAKLLKVKDRDLTFKTECDCICKVVSCPLVCISSIYACLISCWIYTRDCMSKSPQSSDDDVGFEMVDSIDRAAISSTSNKSVNSISPDRDSFLSLMFSRTQSKDSQNSMRFTRSNENENENENVSPNDKIKTGSVILSFIIIT